MNEIIKFFSSIPIGVFSVFAACITVGGGFFVWKHQRLVTASDSFCAAFSESLFALRHSDACPFDVLETAFPSHKTAVREFSRFLSYFKRKAFLAAWQQYAYHDEKDKFPHPFLEQYSSAGCSISEAKQLRELAIKRLEHLLSYAKHT